MSCSNENHHLSLVEEKKINVDVVSKTVGHGLPPRVYEMLDLPAVDDRSKNEFLNFLSKSWSLNYEEKLKVIDSMPALSEMQVDSLVYIFYKECREFNNIGYRVDN